jgi:hypothetical protein
MDNKWKINFELLKIAKEKGHCPCDKDKACPCEEFLNYHKCHCNAYIKEA